MSTTTDKHVNSRMVTIFRAGGQLARAQGPAVQEYLAGAKVSVGSYFENRNSSRIASGLSTEEERVLLPEFLRVSVEDRRFLEEVNKFYSELDTSIPPEGLPLEVGLVEDNEKPVSIKNMPIVVGDYLRYRQIAKHPFVAKNKEESDANSQKQFYVFDKGEAKIKQSKIAATRDAAMQIYLGLKKDMNKIDWVMTVLGKDPREFTGKTKDADKTEWLYKFVTEFPDKFAEKAEAGDLEVQYMIQTMVNVSVLRKLGNKYYDSEDMKKMLGNSLEETVAWFNDAENSESVFILKGKMNELKDQPVSPDMKRTEVSTT